MLRFALPLAAIVAVAVGGCAAQTTSDDSSGKFRGEQRLVANTVEDFESAASKGDQDQICRELLAKALITATGALSGDPGPVHLKLALREPLLPESDDPADLPGPWAGRPFLRTSHRKP